MSTTTGTTKAGTPRKRRPGAGRPKLGALKKAKTLGFRLSNELVSALKNRAQTQNRTATEVVTEILERELLHP